MREIFALRYIASHPCIWFVFYAGLDTMTILTIRFKTVIVNHDELRHRNKGGITNPDGLRHGDFELL